MIDGNMTMRSGFLRLLKRLRQFLLIAGVAVPGIVLSQVVYEAEQLAEEEVEEIRRYTVEMIVFEYAESAVSGDEGFVPDELPDDLSPIARSMVHKTCLPWCALGISSRSHRGDRNMTIGRSRSVRSSNSGSATLGAR